MNNPDQNEVATGASTSPTELDLLKEDADALGMTYHPSIGIKKLKVNIQEFIKKRASKTAIVEEPVVAAPPSKPIPEDPAKARLRIVKEATRLRRVRVTCMNPNKKEWEGEVFTASNSIIPTQKKYVPFNAEDGWHVPQIILNVMRERKCQVFKTTKGPRGEKIRKGSLVPEFAIDILDPLTQEEMEELATQQAMANNLG